jgi:hypothetical protein
MQVSPETPFQVKRQRPIRVCATADLQSRTWLFKIHDERTREIVAWDFGELPPYYRGLNWNPSTAAHYALALAAIYIVTHLSQCRVVLACSGPASPRRRDREERRRRWAA